MRTLNILVYYPGYAGHFITQILSINDNAFVPSLIKEGNDKLSKSRFKNVYWRHGSWREFHQSYYIPQWDAIAEFLNQETCDVFTVKMHPADFFKIIELSTQHLEKIENKNYLAIELSPSLKYITDDFTKRNGNWPNITALCRKNFNLVIRQYDPYIINLDNIFYGVDTFVDEYEKLCEHLSYKKHIDQAIILYSEWRNARRLDDLNGGPTRT